MSNNITFVPNAYYNAYTKDLNLRPEEAAKAILDSVKDNPQYAYGNVDYNKFITEYAAPGWECRKVYVILYVLSEIAKATISIAKICLKFPLVVTRGWTFIKVDCYRAGRALEGGAGWIVTFFNDSYGSYLVFRSRFHRQCYDCIELSEVDSTNNRKAKLKIPEKPYEQTESPHGERIPVTAKIHTLEKLKNCNPADRQELEKAYNLRNRMKEYENKLNIEFYKRLEQQLSPEQLKTVTIREILLPFNKSKLPWLLRSDDEIRKVPLSTIPTDCIDPLKVIRERLSQLYKQKKVETSSTKKEEKAPSVLGTLYLGDILSIDSLFIVEHKDSLNPLVLSLCQDEQVKKLELHLLTKPQCQSLFYALKPDQIQQRLTCYRGDDIRQAIKDNKLEVSVLLQMSNNLLEGLKLSELTQPAVSAILPESPPNGLSLQELTNRLLLFSGEDVNAAIKNSLLVDKRRLAALSEKHYAALELRAQVGDLFPQGVEIQEARRRFAFIKPEAVKKGVEAGFIKGGYHTSLLSLEQRCFIGCRGRSMDYLNDLLNLEGNREVDLATVASWQARDLFNAVREGRFQSPYQLGLIPDQHFLNCPLSTFNSATISTLFPYGGDFSVQSRRFAHINDDEVFRAFESNLLVHCPHYLISNGQLKYIFEKKTLQEVMNIASDLSGFFQHKEEPSAEDLVRFDCFPEMGMHGLAKDRKLTGFIQKMYDRVHNQAQAPA